MSTYRECGHFSSHSTCIAQVDGYRGDHVLLAPAYTIAEEDLVVIIDIFLDALDATMVLLEGSKETAA